MSKLPAPLRKHALKLKAQKLTAQAKIAEQREIVKAAQEQLRALAPKKLKAEE